MFVKIKKETKMQKTITQKIKMQKIFKIQKILIPFFLIILSCSEEKIVDVYVGDGITSSYDKVYFGTVLKDQSDTTNNIMPLNKGNWWSYSIGYYINNCDFYINDYEVLEVLSEEIIDGNTWYRMKTNTNSGCIKYFYYTNTTTGLFCKLTRDSEPFLLCPKYFNSVKKTMPSEKFLFPIFNDAGIQIDFGFYETADGISVEFDKYPTPKKVTVGGKDVYLDSSVITRVWRMVLDDNDEPTI